MCGNFFTNPIKTISKEVTNIVNNPWPTLGTIIGSVVGGPLGAAAGNALGNVASQGPSNFIKNLGQNALSAGEAGVGSYVAGAASNAISPAVSSAASDIGSTASSYLPSGLTSAASSIGDAASNLYSSATGGVSGLYQGVLNSLGMGGADGVPASGMNAGDAYGPPDPSTQIGGVTSDGEMVSPQVLAADQASSAASGNVDTSGLATGNAATGGGMLSKIPVVGSILQSGANWASSNPIPSLMGAGMLYSAYTTNKARAEQQKQAQDQQAANAANNAAQQTAWDKTLNTPPLNRTANPNAANINYNTYGYGPEQSFFNNNQTSLANNVTSTAPTTMATGGRINKYDGGGSVSPSQQDANDDMMNKMLDAQAYASGGAVDNEPDMYPVASSSPSVQSMSNLRQKMSKLPKQPTTDGENDMEPIRKAKGGSAFPRKTGKIKGAGGGMSDKVKAMLSDGEYVVPADVVSHFGDGSNDAGADALDHLIKKVRMMKTGKSTQPHKMSLLGGAA